MRLAVFRRSFLRAGLAPNTAASPCQGYTLRPVGRGRAWIVNS